MWAVVNVIARSVGGFLFDTYDHFCVVMTEKKKTKLIYGVPLFSLHHTHGQVVNAPLFSGLYCVSVSNPVLIIPVVVIWGPEDVIHAEIPSDEWWFVDLHRDVTTSHQGGHVVFIFYFLVMSDHVQWSIDFSELNECEENLKCFWAGLMHNDTWIQFVA